MADAAASAISEGLSRRIPLSEDPSEDRSRRETLDSTLTRYPGFPRPPIMFIDVFPLFRAPALLQLVVTAMASEARHMIDSAPGGSATNVGVAGFESRGFLHGVPLALALNVPFIGIRKAGKRE